MRRLAMGAMLLAALGSCHYQKRQVRSPESLATSSGRYTKLHLRDGTLVVLQQWHRGMGVVVGTGVRYDVDRKAVATGPMEVRLDEVLLVETTERENLPEVYPMVILTVLTLGLTAYCAAETKACFGSCPTFYVPSETAKDGWSLQAEGFSTSIARALEATDIDALPAARADGGAVTVVMRNEALETHVVTGLSLLAVDAPPGSIATQRAGGGFDAIGPTTAPSSCDDADVCAALREADFDEWTPGSDGEDLAARTSFTMRWPAQDSADVSLVITARNSLMTTYVLYQMLAYHGSKAGEMIARIERRDPDALMSLAKFKLALGGIDVWWRQGEDEWRHAGTIDYTGPIARTTKAVTFRVDEPRAPIEVKLELARADWRIDAARLGPVVARDLAAEEIAAESTTAPAVGETPLMTMPGDEHTFRFAVGDRVNASYFLKSRGWYYEWIRQEWLAEENAEKAAAYMADPSRALRELAPAYHAREGWLDGIFERSRFQRAGGEGAP